MNLNLLLDNLTNPALLFFLLGIIAVRLKSDLEIPPNSSKFIALYLLFSIGFKGGQELAHSNFNLEIVWSVLFGIGIATAIPFYSYFILRRKFNSYDSGAIAAAYGSVSAVTFVTAASFLEIQSQEFSGHMVAVMALMEAPAIIIGVILIRLFNKQQEPKTTLLSLVKHSFTNGSVLLILGSLVIGFLASEEQAMGIKPFTTDMFKGFLSIFLLDMGIVSGRKLQDFIKSGWFAVLFAIAIPLINGCIVALCSHMITDSIGNRFIFAILAASASYIAVPAALKIAVPKANPGLYLPMALAVTFPFNITLGMPIYYSIILATLS
ncbi:MAG: sodium-dependent bicarbonate transport family permease [Flavobacteriaceae bacterium]|uniref:Sodium-dependent bicarbonate transport family permease n=1 Tax=Flavobacterium kayseriense TaxID=2764714 RepID=A0ABR7J8Y8_9FLAO|nr:sodium-dependent bicarbonate transport family permease [Flavobacterium kayseriense]MBC5842025.1 sodium-dependent bicarbonate transport family permease [Flavobacterium kayseriense]MBC5848554.1 sodium-dependent bicarbonate transport family permease [Flavobacterium kayseriense]MBU0941230.1 sodium-dependent bicarbonate transport family permease [Bacteroidota bacterium]MBX9887931.1 sodium-dependent bicarbonate transport family permease [Flavobacteriaceae bacterium]